MIVEYSDKDGFVIVRVSQNKYYYGNGNTVNGFGVSANQFLRFHPYMEYVGDKNQKPSDIILKWIENNK